MSEFGVEESAESKVAETDAGFEDEGVRGEEMRVVAVGLGEERIE